MDVCATCCVVLVVPLSLLLFGRHEGGETARNAGRWRAARGCREEGEATVVGTVAMTVTRPENSRLTVYWPFAMLAAMVDLRYAVKWRGCYVAVREKGMFGVGCRMDGVCGGIWTCFGTDGWGKQRARYCHFYADQRAGWYLRAGLGQSATHGNDHSELCARLHVDGSGGRRVRIAAAVSRRSPIY